MENPRVSIQTIGCKLNQAESEAIAAEIALLGYYVTSGVRADAFVINTCTVTNVADRKARHLVRLIRRLNPDSFILVTGCYAHRAGQDLVKCGADVIVDNPDKNSIPLMLDGKLRGQPYLNRIDSNIGPVRRIRSFIKIQDGCNNFCSYCIVPLVRRDIYSVDTDLILKTIEEKVKLGYKEIVLTGLEIGAYLQNGTTLSGLIRRILYETKIQRLRLSSLQPTEISRELLCLWKDLRMCPHIHLALQSGSNKILRRMRRKYDISDFKRAVDTIRDIIPDASITTDIMVGFPGEGDKEFQESYDFCRQMKFSAMHVFSYSPRPGTVAAEMTDSVSEKIKKARSLIMLRLASELAEQFARKFRGRVRKVLWENEVKPGSGIYVGLTDNYIRVYTEGPVKLTNTITEAKLIKPVSEMAVKTLRSSTKGNYGELWGKAVI